MADQKTENVTVRSIYTVEQKAKGRPRKFAGKVRFDDLSRFELAGEIDGQRGYTAIVNSPTFKRNLRIVYIVREEKGKTYTAYYSALTLTVRRWTSCAITKQDFRLSSCFAMPNNTLEYAIAKRLPKQNWASISMLH